MSVTRIPLAGLLLALNACAGPAPEPEVPRYEPADQTKCGVHKSQDRPLIIEWPSHDRAALESRLRRGVVAVRYEGCEMEVLRCGASIPYQYQGVTFASEQVTIEDVDTLYANLPLGAVSLEGRLEEAGRLDVAMTIAGRYEAQGQQVDADALSGDDCALATHVVTGINVGAFSLTAGGNTRRTGNVGVLGGKNGRHSQRARTELKRGGDVANCSAATRDDREPPEGCGALLRLEVVPVGAAKQAQPTCPSGWRWTGTQCVKRVQPKVAAQPAVPDAPQTEEESSDYLWVLGVLGGVALNAVWIVPVAIGINNEAQDNPIFVPGSPARDGGLDEAPLGGWKVEF